MTELLRKIFHRLTNNAVVNMLRRIYAANVFYVVNLPSYMRVRNVVIKKRHERKNERIRVVFLVQNKEVWYKSESIYQAMKRDEIFDINIVVVPDITDKDGEETYRYFEEKYHNIICAGRKGDLFDLRELNPDYVFYTRPYDFYLPKKYRSNIVSKYAKICYCSYAFSVRYEALKGCMPRLFFINVHLFFAESEFIKHYNRKRFPLSYRKYRKTEFLGYPIMDQFQDIYVEKETETVKFLWTPRWSTDTNIGGSNFFEYKDILVDYVLSCEDIKLIFRPHPLAFYNFVSKGQMTEEEVKSYCARYSESAFLEIDETANYVGSFQEADVLISDISSMIFEWYTTGKPIIFCATATVTDFELMEQAIEGCYIANNWSELKNIMGQLKDGNDPLKKKREQLSKELFGSDIKNAGQNIADYIKRDYMQ